MTDYEITPPTRIATAQEHVILYQNKPVQRIFVPKDGWWYKDVDGAYGWKTGEYRP